MQGQARCPPVLTLGTVGLYLRLESTIAVLLQGGAWQMELGQDIKVDAGAIWRNL